MRTVTVSDTISFNGRRKFLLDFHTKPYDSNNKIFYI